MVNWCVGWNMCAYSPDPDVLWVTDDYGAAVDYLLDTLERWFGQDGESWDDATDRCPWDQRNDEYLSVVSEVEGQRVNGAEVSALFPERNGYDWHFWVVPTDEPVSVMD